MMNIEPIDQPRSSQIRETRRHKNTFVSTVDDLSQVSSKRVILVGESVIALETDTKANGYYKLAPRLGVPRLKGLLDKNAKRVFLSVSEEIVNKAPKNVQFAFAIDAYLAYGFTTKGSVLLLGGFSSSAESLVLAFHFKEGALVSVEERTIAGYGASNYADAGMVLIDALLKDLPKGTKVFSAPPLAQFGGSVTNVEYLSENIFDKLSYGQITRSNASKGGSAALVPVAIALVGAVVYGGAFAKGWFQFESAVSQFEESIKDPVVRIAGGVGGPLIEKIQQQKMFMEEPKTQVPLSSKARELVYAISKIPDVKIKELTVSGPPDGRGGIENSMLKMVLTVPQTGRAALDQGKEILDVLSNHTGLNLHMAPQGWRDVEKRRHFTLEGQLNG